MLQHKQEHNHADSVITRIASQSEDVVKTQNDSFLHESVATLTDKRASLVFKKGHVTVKIAIGDDEDLIQIETDDETVICEYDPEWTFYAEDVLDEEGFEEV